MPQHIRQRVIYTGRVQGVGFRAGVRGIASGYSVSGYVRNQDDGTVELVVDGPASAVEQCVSAVQDRFSRNIQRADSTPISGGEPLTGFTIRW